MAPMQYLGANGLGGLVLAVVVPLLVVALGSYVGVLMALQSFFEASSWEEATGEDGD
jgi:hypothetical protein